jgi:hypothetical protein
MAAFATVRGSLLIATLASYLLEYEYSSVLEYSTRVEA